MNGFDLRPWQYVEVAQGLAAGLREGDGGAHIMSYHPGGPNSSSYFQHENWLAFNIIQVWADYWRAHPMVAADIASSLLNQSSWRKALMKRVPNIRVAPLPLWCAEGHWSYLGGGFHCYRA